MAVDYTGLSYGDSTINNSMVCISKDFSANDNNVDVSATGALELIKVPAGCWVHKVAINITTAETDDSNDSVLDLGDGADADGWGVDINAEAAAATCDFDSAYHAAGGKYYGSADTIDVTGSHDLDDIEFTLYVWYTKL